MVKLKRIFIPIIIVVFLYSYSHAEVEKIYWTEWVNDGLWMADQNESSPNKLWGVPMFSLTGLTIDPVNNKLYTATGYELLRSNLDGSDVETIIQKDNRGSLYNISLDLERQKIYWGKGEMGFRRSNLDGTDSEIIYSSGKTYQMKINPLDDQLYWTSYSGIHKANPDGSNMKLIIKSPDSHNYSGLDFDLYNHKIYFSRFETGGIYRSNMDGTNVELFLNEKTASFEIDPISREIYWTSWTLNYNTDAYSLNIKRSSLDIPNAKILYSMPGASNSIALLIPEPITLGLLFFGGLTLLRRRKPE